MSQTTNNSYRGLVILIALLFISALATFAFNGTFSRMIADDYCTAATGLESGAWGGMLVWYNDWSGLYSNFFVKSALAPAPPALYALLPATLIIGWVLSLWVCFRELLLWAKIPRRRWLILGLVLLMSFATINSSPGRQNTYWFGALISNTFPAIPLTLIVAMCIWIVRKPRGRRDYLLTGSVLTFSTFILVGFKETYATFMVTALILMIALAFWQLPERRQGVIAFLLPILIAAIAGLVVILLAPGNDIRQARVLAEAGMTQTPSLFELVIMVASLSAQFFVVDTYGVAHFLFVLFGTMLLCMWVWRNQPDELAMLPIPRHPIRTILITIGITYLLVASILTPGLYATQIVTPRVTFLPRAVQIGAMMFVGYWLAVWLTQTRTLIPLRKRPVYRITRLALLGMLVFLPVSVILTNLGESAGYHLYAKSWDARHAQIEAAVAQGNTDITVPELPFYMEDVLLLERIEKTGAYNSCGLRFYGAERITVVPAQS